MKGLRISTRLHSGLGLVITAILLVVVVALSSILLRGARIDLTDNTMYTLTDGTKSILKKLDEPVDVYFFFSKKDAQGSPPLVSYGEHVREVLEEMAGYANDNLRLHVIDPDPFSEDEDRASRLGVQPVPIGNTGNNLYFGVAMSNAVGRHQTIAFLQPDRETLLEYDLSKALFELNRTKKPVLGVLSSLPMQGGFDPQRMAPKPGWIVYEQLKQMFDVRPLDPAIKAVDKDIDLLLLVHPAALANPTAYAIDQYVMRGGKVLAFVDPYSQIASAGGNGFQANNAQSLSDPKELLQSWGLSMRSGVVLGDATHALQVGIAPGAPPVFHYAMLGLGEDSANQSDVAMRGLKRVNVAFAGILDPVKESGIEVTPLMQSSAQSAPLQTMLVQTGGDPTQLQRGFAPSGERYTVAARVHGVAKSAFGSGPPASATTPAEGHLAQSTQAINVVVIADTDMLTDRFWVRVQEFFGQQLASPWASNGDLVLNLADNLAGSSDLIGIRGRANFARPFDRVEELKRQADARFLDKERELQTRLRETENKLAAMERGKADENAPLLTAQQQQEIQNFRAEKVRIRKELREVRHELDQDIEKLGSVLKFINIALSSILLLVGVAIWKLMRRRKPVSAASEGAQ